MRIPLILGVSAILFLAMLGQRDIVISHEARVAQVAREMAHTGWPWNAQPQAVPAAALVEVPGVGLRLRSQDDKPPMQVNVWGIPTLNGQVRLQKPPLPYWCAALAFRVWGITEGAARFTPALLGFLAVLLMWDLGRRLLGRLGGWVVALVWVSSYFIQDEYRKAMPDPYLAFFSLGCLWAWIRATNARRQTGFLVLFYLLLAFGLLAKGPPIFIHLLIPIAAYHICYRRKVPKAILGHLLGLAVLLAVALPWPLYVLRHLPNAMELWRYESVGELTDNVENARPWWFYLPNLFQLALPWTPFWLAAMAYPWLRDRRAVPELPIRNSHSRRTRRLFFPWIWYVAVVVFFSLVNLKKNAYLLPLMPAQALLIGQVVLGMMARARRIKRDDWVRWFAIAQAGMGVGFGIALAGMLIMDVDGIRRISGLKEGIATFLGGLVHARGLRVAMIALALTAGLYPALLRRPTLLRWFGTQAICYGVLLFILFNFWATPRENLRSPKPFVAQLLPKLMDRSRTLSLQRVPEEVLFYLPPGIEQNPEAPIVLVAIDGRAKHRREDAAWFAPDVPGDRITQVRKVPMPTESRRNRWMLYELTTERPVAMP